LEGCDSTTELLPPTRSLSSLLALRRENPPRCFTDLLPTGLPAEARWRFTRAKVVAREGLEPSKPLGRQIYSLLRLTASLPSQWSRCNPLLYTFQPALPEGLEEGDPGSHRHVQTLNVPLHRDRREHVAPLPDQPPQSGPFRPHHHRRRHRQVHVGIRLRGIAR